MALSENQLASIQSVLLRQSGASPDILNSLDKDQLMRVAEAIKLPSINSTYPQKKLIADLIVQANPVAARAATYARGLPFIGESIDELAGMQMDDEFDPSGRLSRQIQQQVTGATPEQAKEIVQEERTLTPDQSESASNRINILIDSMEESRPKESFAGQMFTGVIPELFLGAALLPKRGVSTLSTAWSGAKRLAGYGTVEGVVSGLGQGETLEERGMAAGVRGAAGGVLGGVFGGIGGAFFANSFNKKFNNPVFAKKISDELGIREEAATVFIDLLGSGKTVDDAISAIEQMGERAMLVNAGSATTSLLDAVQQQGSLGAREISKDAIDKRAMDSGATLTRSLDENFGVPSTDTMQQQLSRSSSRTQVVRQEAYDRVYNNFLDYSTPKGVRVLESLRLIPDSILSKAMQEANNVMQSEGRGAFKIAKRFIVDPDGFVDAAKDLNPAQLDYISRALGRMSKETLEGRPSPDAIIANNILPKLLPALNDFLPNYAAAKRLGLDNILEARAIDIGKGFFRPTTTRNEIASLLSNVTGVAKEDLLKSLRQSVRNSIDEAVANTRRTLAEGGNVADNTIQETKKLIQTLTSKASLDKMRLILPSEEAVQKVVSELNEAISVFGLQSAVSRNSATASRTAVGTAIGDIVQTSTPKGIRENAMSMLMQSDREVVASTLEDMASVLTRLTGNDARDALILIKKIAAQRTTSRENAEQLASKFWKAMFVLPRGVTPLTADITETISQ
jgi:hypothetical protein